MNKKFLGISNLEFTFFSDAGLSEKILYRSFGSSQEFKNKIYSYLLMRTHPLDIHKKIEKIFTMEEVQNLIFHFGEDSATGRIKFYISLYGLPIKKALIILSKIKKILGIKKIYLENNFLSFDCLGFDIAKDKIELKIYEITSMTQAYRGMLPSYVSQEKIKEVGVLKTQERKKVFFRFNSPLDIPEKIYNVQCLKQLRESLSGIYNMEGKMTYYCIEGEREEIYFI